MFAHILHSKFTPCSAFLCLKEETGKEIVMVTLRLCLESHSAPHSCYQW